jgi:pyruvate/2-oxoglutarate dehydrogenase complex dihydrolipoamide dehydrogenase (E3) component
MKLKDLFKKKKKEEVKEEEPKEEVKSLPKCAYCGRDIESWDKRKTHAKQKYHVKCFRYALKEAKKQIMNGQQPF